MEAKDLIEFLGFDPEQVKDIDSFKGEFGKKYFTEKQVFENKDILGKFTGKTLGSITSKMKKKAKEDYSLEFDAGQFDDQDPLLAMEAVVTKLREQHESNVTELKGQIGKSGEDAIKPWQEKVSKYESSLNDEKLAKKAIADQFEAYKAESANSIKSTRIDYFRKDLMTSIPYDSQIMKDDLKRRGWEAHVADNFKFDFDEHDQPVILDKTGSKIRNPKKADEWLTPKDVLTSEADKLGLLPKNQQGNRPAGALPPGMPPPPASVKTAFTPAATEPGKPERRKVAPGMEQYLK